MIYIAVGANLPGPNGASALGSCRAALGQLQSIAGLRRCATSRWYRTAAVPASSQPDYVNGVVAMEGAIAPAALLRALQAIEAAFGRVRGVANAARTLDLDIVDLDGMVRQTPDPVLPHPRAHLRGFVLYPLRDVAPGWVHPVLGAGVEALIAGLPAERVEVVAE